MLRLEYLRQEHGKKDNICNNTYTRAYLLLKLEMCAVLYAAFLLRLIF